MDAERRDIDSVKFCPPGKRAKRSYCTSNSPIGLTLARHQNLPIIDVTVEGAKAKALVDMGCTTTLVIPWFVRSWSG